MYSIVTGGAGFVGYNLINKLKNKIIVIDCLIHKNQFLIDNIKKKKLIFIKYDLSRKDSPKVLYKKLKKFRNIREIWHLAANSDINKGSNDLKIDLNNTFFSTLNSIVLAKKLNIKKFNFASSSAIYGDHGSKKISENTGPLKPQSNYGAFKLASEAVLLSNAENAFKLNIFRFPNVVGYPLTHGILYDFFKKIKKNNKKLNVLGDGSQKKIYLDVEYLVNAMIFVNQKNNKKKINILNIGPFDNGVTVKWIAKKFIQILGLNTKIIYQNKNIGWKGDVPTYRYSNDKLRKFGIKKLISSSESIKIAIKKNLKFLGKND